MPGDGQQGRRAGDARQSGDDPVEHFLHLIDGIDRGVFLEENRFELGEAKNEQLNGIAGLDLPQRHDRFFDDVDRLTARGGSRHELHLFVDRHIGIALNPVQQIDDVAEVVGIDLLRRAIELRFQLGNGLLPRFRAIRFENTEERATTLGALLSTEILKERADLQAGEKRERLREQRAFRFALAVFPDLLEAERFDGVAANAVDGRRINFLLRDHRGGKFQHGDSGRQHPAVELFDCAHHELSKTLCPFIRVVGERQDLVHGFDRCRRFHLCVGRKDDVPRRHALRQNVEKAGGIRVAGVRAETLDVLAQLGIGRRRCSGHRQKLGGRLK